MEVSQPILARRTWLWRVDSGAVIEALGFAGSPPSQAGREWLDGLGPVHEGTVGPSSAGRGPGGPVLGWARTRHFAWAEDDWLRGAEGRRADLAQNDRNNTRLHTSHKYQRSMMLTESKTDNN